MERTKKETWLIEFSRVSDVKSKDQRRKWTSPRSMEGLQFLLDKS